MVLPFSINFSHSEVDENKDGEISIQELHAWVTWQEEQAREAAKEQEKELKRQEKASQKELDKTKSKMAAEKRCARFLRVLCLLSDRRASRISRAVLVRLR